MPPRGFRSHTQPRVSHAAPTTPIADTPPERLPAAVPDEETRSDGPPPPRLPFLKRAKSALASPAPEAAASSGRASMAPLSAQPEHALGSPQVVSTAIFRGDILLMHIPQIASDAMVIDPDSVEVSPLPLPSRPSFFQRKKILSAQDNARKASDPEGDDVAVCSHYTFSIH
jgi:hypothetical protein